MTLKRRLVGRIGVDAGLMYLGDPCYVIDDELGKMEWSAFLENHCPNPDNGEMARVVPHPRTGAAVGVVAISGWGDGVYPVEIELDKEGRPRRLIITF